MGPNWRTGRSNARRNGRATLRSGQDRCPDHASSEGHQKARRAPESESAPQAATKAYSVPSSVLLSCERELNTRGQVPDTLPQCESWNECIGRGLTLAMENERSMWRTNIGEERTMNQNPNQKPGQQQQGGQQGGQEKPGQQQQGGQPKPGQCGQQQQGGHQKPGQQQQGQQ